MQIIELMFIIVFSTHIHIKILYNFVANTFPFRFSVGLL